MNEDLEKDIITAKDEFILAVNTLEWNTEFRTKCENLIIAYD